MDIPFAIQTYLQQDPAVQATVRDMSGVSTLSADTIAAKGVHLLEIPEDLDPLMPVECIVIQPAGGPATHGGGTLELNDLRIVLRSYGQTPHLAWNVDAAAYTALKTNFEPSVWAKTYIHWVKPSVKGNLVREPDTQWPSILSTWQALASDLTISP